AAVNGLTAEPDSGVAGALRERLKHEPDVAVGARLIEALGRRRDLTSAPEVAAVLSSTDADPQLVKAALTAAGALGGTESTEAILGWLQRIEPDTELALQLAAIRSAAELRTSAAVPILSKLATALNVEVSSASVAALGQIGGDAARDELLRLLAGPSKEIRKSVLSALAILPGAAAVPELLAAWREPELRADALLALARTPDLRALDAYQEGLTSKNSEQRAASRQALNAIKAAALPLIEAQVRAGALPREAIPELQEIFRDEPGAQAGPIFAARPDVVAPEAYLQFALDNPGDSARGGKLFRDPAGLNCVGCHRLAGEGADVGPDLSNMGAQFGPRELAESILWPSRVVREGYQPIIVELKDGEEVAGLIKGESAELLTLRDSVGRLRQIPKGEVSGRRQSDQSLMPEGLQAGLTLQEFADLVAFATSCRQKN
ncbi:MAG TPA: HEAT repeat domain-containing protein, partial [Verrucomicrobiota bacterium]|nr:HEAT repeat domain-containing protein [Verrucomicrobiota bacterium]